MVEKDTNYQPMEIMHLSQETVEVKGNPMQDETFQVVMKKKRPPQKLTDQEIRKEGTPVKKPFSAHSIRRTTKQLRMDFPTAHTKQQALQKWRKIMKVIRDINQTAIIHSRDANNQVNIKDPIPESDLAMQYTTINTVKKARHNEVTFASLTMVTTARPIQEMKRLHGLLIHQLQLEQVYVRSTLLDSTDTVEIGFFLGLHPSLTNLRWRGLNLSQALATTEPVPPFQIYRMQLKDQHVKTSCVVIQCAKVDAPTLQDRLMTAPPGKLGKGVEFIPYQLSSIWSPSEYLQLYQQQNRYIEEVGATAIQGVSEWTMQTQGNEGKTLHQFLVENPKVLSVEKSDTPQQEKWWILSGKKRPRRNKTIFRKRNNGVHGSK